MFKARSIDVRIGGHYNHVFHYESAPTATPWRGTDARIALTADRTWGTDAFRLTPAAGVLVFSAREKEYSSREKNRHYLGPVIAGIVTVANRLNLGLELTFGAITDFRWRTEIQL